MPFLWHLINRTDKLRIHFYEMYISLILKILGVAVGVWAVHLGIAIYDLLIIDYDVFLRNRKVLKRVTGKTYQSGKGLP